ncbi:hypothetical protein [Caulobacter sp.]
MERVEQDLIDLGAATEVTLGGDDGGIEAGSFKMASGLSDD